MSEEKNGVTHSSANNEMAPQEDGTKLPLTDEPGVKFTSNKPSNGDGKIDISEGQTFSGLTKEELMKYADDPFWVKLRWFLFIVFWAGWVVMLVMAIVIIFQTPRCPPKETLEWVQESAMIQYEVNSHVDVNDDGTESPEDLVQMAKDLGIKTVYLSDLISTYNFEKINNMYTVGGDNITPVLEAAKKAGLHVVTDFIPSSVPASNSWRNNPNMSDFFDVSGNLDFSNQNLLDKLVELLSTTWKERGVLGFLVGNPVDDTLINATIVLTEKLGAVKGAVVHGEIDVDHHVITNFSPLMYKDFLEQHVDDWSYFKFNPYFAESTTSKDLAKLVTLTLFLVPGTPVLHGIQADYFREEKEFIKSLSAFREKESVQVGNMTFLNTTSENVIAFARVMKGTPGCAVAVNFHHENSTVVDFSSITGLPNKGDIHIRVSNATVISGEPDRVELSKINLGPYEGVVVLFVPDLE